MSFYDYRGKPAKFDTTFENIKSNMLLMHGYDEVADTRYTILRIFKQRTDGTKQFPFVRYAREGSTNKNAIELRAKEGWHLIFNAGMGQGLVIQNGIVLTDAVPTKHVGAMPLTIDSNGDLSYVDADTAGKGSQIVASGVVSAVCGFFPIVDNYEKYDYPKDIPETIELPTWQHAQRQIIGQFSNGDYAIITGEGRGYADSIGFSIDEEQELCMRLGLRFAYNLDGGGSTQTLLDKKSVNTIYENETGRRMPTYIVFNGTDTYSIPSN